jgi:hypothetical protein
MRTILVRRPFWLAVSAAVVAILAVRSGVVTSAVPWGMSAGPIFGIPPDWRIWLAIAIGVILAGSFFKPGGLRVNEPTGKNEALTPRPRTYFGSIQDAILGAVTGIAVWDIPLFCLFESGVFRTPGIMLIATWVLIIGAGLGTICGVIAVPWIGALVGSISLAIAFLYQAAPWESQLVLVVMVIGAFFGYVSGLAVLAVRRRFAVLMS